VTGVDPSSPAIAYARRRAPDNCTFAIGVAQDLDLADGSFDVVTSTLVLHHIPQTERPAAFSEMHRMTRPGGRLLVADFHPSRLHPFGSPEMRHSKVELLEDLAAGGDRVVSGPTRSRNSTTDRASRDQQQRRGVGVRRAHVQEVHGLAVDGGGALGVLVEFGLVLAPVVVGAPVGGQAPKVADRPRSQPTPGSSSGQWVRASRSARSSRSTWGISIRNGRIEASTVVVSSTLAPLCLDSRRARTRWPAECC
jgi:Methyltransferase domain